MRVVNINLISFRFWNFRIGQGVIQEIFNYLSHYFFRGKSIRIIQAMQMKPTVEGILSLTIVTYVIVDYWIKIQFLLLGEIFLSCRHCGLAIEVKLDFQTQVPFYLSVLNRSKSKYWGLEKFKSQSHIHAIVFDCEVCPVLKLFQHQMHSIALQQRFIEAF